MSPQLDTYRLNFIDTEQLLTTNNTLRCEFDKRFSDFNLLDPSKNYPIAYIYSPKLTEHQKHTGLVLTREAYLDLLQPGLSSEPGDDGLVQTAMRFAMLNQESPFVVAEENTLEQLDTNVLLLEDVERVLRRDTAQKKQPTFVFTNATKTQQYVLIIMDTDIPSQKAIHDLIQYGERLRIEEIDFDLTAKVRREKLRTQYKKD